MKHRKSIRSNRSMSNLGSRFGGRRAIYSAAALAVMAAGQSVRAQSTIYTYNMNDIVAGVSTSSAGTTISGLTFSNFTTTVGGTANAGSRFSFTNWPLAQPTPATRSVGEST